MAAESGFSYDLFISYSHDDDIADVHKERWVTNFDENLRSTLKGLGYFTNLKIWRDVRGMQAGHVLDEELKKQVRAAAIFVGVLSPNFLKSSWAMDEFNTFQTVAGHTTRTIMVEKRPPPPEREKWPEAIDRLYRPQFFYKDEVKGTIRTIDSNYRCESYAEQVQQLATDIVARHKEARAEIGIGPPAALPDAMVLLGRVTPDLRRYRTQITSYLEGSSKPKIQVIPHDDYPESEERFRERFAADLARVKAAPAGLFVQLVGPYYSSRPEAIAMGYERYQLQEAEKLKLPVLCWRPDSLDATAIAEIDDEQHKQLVLDATTMSPARLNEEIVRRCERPPVDPPPPDSPIVFVNTDEADLEIAQQIRRALVDSKFGVVLPNPESDDLDENMRLCQGLVLVFGSVQPEWVRRQLRQYIKQRSKNRGRVSVFDAPPVPKADFRIDLPELKHVATVEELIAHMRA